MSSAAGRLDAVPYLLKRYPEDGKVELIRDGVTLWSSDTDPDLLEQLRTDTVRDCDMGNVLEYLVDTQHLTEDEADDECIVDSPEDEDDDDDDDDWDDDDDDDDWDDDDLSE